MTLHTSAIFFNACSPDFVAEKGVDMVVVGPEDPLVEGIRDYLEADGRFKDLKIIGPGKAGAILEGSKDFSSASSRRFRINTPFPAASPSAFNT